MESPLTRTDLALLLHAARCSGVEPARLRAENPWRCQGPVAERIRAHLSRLDPVAAERLQAAAAAQPASLQAAATAAGLFKHQSVVTSPSPP